MGPKRRTVVLAWVLFATTIANGPVFAAAEAWIHASRKGLGHGQRIHLESRAARDHDDRCGVGLVSARAHSVIADPPAAVGLDRFPVTVPFIPECPQSPALQLVPPPRPPPVI